MPFYSSEYQSCLMDLEELLSTLPPSQQTMIVGDFNAHLADARNSSVPNTQGVALWNLIDRNSLYVASLDKGASGPSYTNSSGVVKTTVDYILVNQCASYLVISSEVLKDHPLNTSDHLALHTTLEVNTVKVWDGVPWTPRINWNSTRFQHPTILEHLWASATSGRGEAGYVYELRGDACALTGRLMTY